MPESDSYIEIDEERSCPRGAMKREALEDIIALDMDSFKSYFPPVFLTDV
jgi:hypothetical protein